MLPKRRRIKKLIKASHIAISNDELEDAYFHYLKRSHVAFLNIPISKGLLSMIAGLARCIFYRLVLIVFKLLLKLSTYPNP